MSDYPETMKKASIKKSKGLEIKMNSRIQILISNPSKWQQYLTSTLSTKIIVQRNQIIVLTASIVSILVLAAIGVYFAISASQTYTGGMMGGGTTTNPYSWIISAILFGAVLVIAIGLVFYFGATKKTQSIEQRKEPINPVSLSPAQKIEQKSITEIRTHKIKGRVATGYTDLDNLLLGGIPPKLAVALTAPLSDEVNSLIKAFIETGAKKGEITFFVTNDASLSKDLVREFPSNFYLFNLNPQVDKDLGKAPNVFSIRSIDNLTEINIAIMQSIRKLDPTLKVSRRFCLNVVSDVLLQHGLVVTRKWLSELIAALNAAEFTILAVINSQMHSSEDVYALLGLFDGEISIRETESVKEFKRYLKVRRMSNQEYLKSEILLTED